MRTSINYSSYSGSSYYTVSKEADKPDEVFDRFREAIKNYPELDMYLESLTEDLIMYRIPSEDTRIQLLINKIVMICYQGCVYNELRPCEKCAYKGYCDVINGGKV